MTRGETDVRNLDNIIELNHPLIKYKLGLLRKNQRGTNKFRELANKIGVFLCLGRL